MSRLMFRAKISLTVSDSKNSKELIFTDKKKKKKNSFLSSSPWSHSIGSANLGTERRLSEQTTTVTS